DESGEEAEVSADKGASDFPLLPGLWLEVLAGHVAKGAPLVPLEEQAAGALLHEACGLVVLHQIGAHHRVIGNEAGVAVHRADEGGDVAEAEEGLAAAAGGLPVDHAEEARAAIATTDAKDRL